MVRKNILRIGVVLVVVAVVVGVAAGVYQATNGGKSSKSSQVKPPTPFLTVSGNQLVNRQGKPTHLVGVDMGASQYYCLGKNTEPFPAPIDNTTVSAIKAWHVNTVRILLNAYCWLGTDGEPAHTTSSDYRSSIESFVSMLGAQNIEVILTMTETGGLSPGTGAGKGKKKQGKITTEPPMAELGTAPAFWTSVASNFRGSPNVIFDLFGEPEQISWDCWENGCQVGGTQVAGMQKLVNVVRAAGSHQALMLGGIDWSNNLTDWIQHEPNDPDHQLIASVHVYEKDHCVTTKCWNTTIATTAKKVPVVTGEFGDENCSTKFTQKYMQWADKHHVSYVAWAWLTGTPCTSGGSLIASYSGTPTAYGQAIKDHVATVNSTGQISLASWTVPSGLTDIRSRSGA